MANSNSNEVVLADQLTACLNLLHVVESLKTVSGELMKECEGKISESKVKRGLIVLHHNLESVANRSKEISKMTRFFSAEEEIIDDIPHDGPYCRLRDENPPGLIWLSRKRRKHVN